ncbi:sensor histidine kinase [Clostridium sp. MB05]|uniref:sensor histidine kinase n=1 Tax=Clostridium sp. MB05 TaxID=3376682 RepID=UPI003981962F
MKFWKKIFLYSVTLTIILITGIGVIFIEKMHYSNLERTITDAIENQQNIINSIYLSYDTNPLINFEMSVDNIELILRNYVYSNVSNIENIQIFSLQNELITSTREYKPEGINELLEKINGSEKLFTIRDDNGKKVLLVGSEFKIQNNDYKLVLTKDINYLYREKIENYKLFFILSILINIFLVIGMYIISKRVTKPIVKLADLSVKISNGKYDNRAEDIGRKDEVGILAKNFNNMLESLQSKMNELEDMNIEKERFINNLTHEIKTPITSIIGYSDLLLKANINDEIKEKALSYINSEGRRLENLSSTLIKLTRIKNETIELEEVNVKNSIDQAINALRNKLESKNIHLKVNVDIKESYIIAEKQLTVVLIKNILENAIKASKYNDNIDILILKKQEEYSEVKIKDYGSGIPKEDLEKILEPFYMVDKARDRSQNGMGLGLSICSEICNLFNIKLRIDSKEEIGTEVILTFNNI